MNSTSLFEKVSKFLTLIIKSPALLIFVLFALLLAITMIIYNKKSSLILKIFLIVMAIGLFISNLIIYINPVLNGLDDLMNKIVLNVFFPSPLVYLLVLLISFIIIVKTIVRKNKNKIINIVNIAFFSLIVLFTTTLLFLSINSNLSFASRKLMYSNSSATLLIQLTAGVFIIWLAVLAIINYKKVLDILFINKKAI